MTENSWERKISGKKGNNGSFGGEDDIGEEREGQSSQRGKLRSTLGGGQLRCLTITNLKVMRQFITRGGEPFHVVVRTSRRSVRRGDVVRDMCGLIWCRRRRGGHRAQSRDDICGRQKKQRQPPPHSFPSTGAAARALNGKRPLSVFSVYWQRYWHLWQRAGKAFILEALP